MTGEAWGLAGSLTRITQVAPAVEVQTHHAAQIFTATVDVLDAHIDRMAGLEVWAGKLSPDTDGDGSGYLQDAIEAVRP